MEIIKLNFVEWLIFMKIPYSVDPENSNRILIKDEDLLPHKAVMDILFPGTKEYVIEADNYVQGPAVDPIEELKC